MPVAHHSDVTKSRAILLFAIATGRSVNVGQVIYHSMRHIRRRSTTVGLGYPSLITALCPAVSVVWDSREELVHPGVIIDKNFISRYRGPGPQGA